MASANLGWGDGGAGGDHPGAGGDHPGAGGDQPEGGGRRAPVVTISASYGAGGSVIAPAVAARLGLRFVDRLVSADLAQGAATSGEGISEAEEKATPHSRFFSYLAQAAPFGAPVAPPIIDLDGDEAMRERAEAPLRQLRRQGGGVVLGRAAAAVLRGQGSTFHVRLDGPEKRRVAQAARIEDISVEDAETRRAATDRARSAYVRRLYRVDPADPSLYQLVVDTTVIDFDTAVDLVVTASRAALGIQ